MTPTSWRSLLPAFLLAAVSGWLLFNAAYGSIVKLPTFAAVTAGMAAVFELVLAKVIRDRVQRRVSVKPMHPLQVARAAVLAKASSLAGTLLLGVYVGFLVWTFPRKDRLAAASDDLVVATVSAAACLVLVIAALVLEHVCRTPEQDED